MRDPVQTHHGMTVMKENSRLLVSAVNLSKYAISNDLNEGRVHYLGRGTALYSDQWVFVLRRTEVLKDSVSPHGSLSILSITRTFRLIVG